MSTAVGDTLVSQDARQQEPFDWTRAYTQSSGNFDPERALLLDDVSLKELLLDVIKKGVPGLDVSDSVIAGDVIRDTTAASQVTVTVHDYGRAVINHQGFYDDEGHLRTIDLNLDGLVFRLVGMEKQGDDVVITFEDRDINGFRQKKGPLTLGGRKAGRSKKGVTRAEAILMVIRRGRWRRIPVQINELHKPQPIAKLTESERSAAADARRTKKKRDVVKDKGFPANFKMEGVDQTMLDNMTVALDEAEIVLKQRGITGDLADRVKLIMLVAGWGESGWLKSANDYKTATHKGVFQSNQIPPNQLRTQAHYFTIGGRSFRSGGAIAAAKVDTWTIGMAAQKVEISDGQASYYQGFLKKANKILDAWGREGESGTSGKQRRKHYVFKIDNRETYWDAIQRMANEVNWRAFFSGGTFFYISEEDLFKSRARYRFSEHSPGVVNIDYKQDQRRTTKTATATVRANRWAIPPGVCVYIDNLGSGTGKWLVQSVSRSLFSAEATLNLVQPLPEKKEPFEGFTTAQGGNAGASGGDVTTVKSGDLANRLYKAAKQIGAKRYPYVWGGGHAKAGKPDRGTGRDPGIGYDCSGGVAACLYYANALPKALHTNVPRSDILAASLDWRTGVGDSVTIWANPTHIFIEVFVNGAWAHLGTGRFGKDWSGFGVNRTLHTHQGFTPFHPQADQSGPWPREGSGHAV